MSSPQDYQEIKITLRGRHNITYRGTLIFSPNLNGTVWDSSNDNQENVTTSGKESTYDQAGASYYVIAVILVYGMSIVLLIASHIKRRQGKVAEDKQIHKYLQDFQIVKERHARDSYKNLKRTIMTKINWDRHRKPTHHNLQQSIIPFLAIGVPTAEQLSDQDAQSISSSLSNVDLAAAEQYMIAKVKGKVYPTRRPSNVLTAAYFAAARRLSRDQSPHTLAKMYKERRISRDHGAFGLAQFLDRRNSQEPMYIPSTYYPSRPSRSRAGSSGAEPDVLLEEPEISETSPLQETAEAAGGNSQHPGSQDGVDKKVHFISPLQCVDGTDFTVSPYPSSNSEVTKHVDTGSLKRSSVSPPHELQVPNIWYNNPVKSSDSRTPSPTTSGKMFPGQGSSKSSPVSPRGSPGLSGSPRTLTSILSDGSREELMQITCL